jgi:acetyl esterase/lipase
LASGEQRFPAQLTDIKCAIAWVKNNAAHYRVDPERLALLGRSAASQRS